MNPSSNQGPVKGFNPELYKSFLNEGNDINSPYFSQDAQKTQADLNANVNQRNIGYNYDLSNTQNSFGNDLRELNNSEGEKGTWGSSARDIRLNSLNNSYKSSFGNLYNKAFTGNQRDLQTGEYELGQNYKLPENNVGQYNFNVNQGTSGNVPIPGNTQQSKYNPFGFYGRNPVGLQNANINYANKTYARAFPNRQTPQ